MKNSTLRFASQALCLVTLIALGAPGHAQTPPPAVKPPPTTAPGADPGPGPTPEQLSYLFGLIYGVQMHNTGITSADVIPEPLVRGVKDGLQGKQLTPADQQQAQAFARAMFDAMSARNASAAKEFLARNGKEKGTFTTASGLQYRILANGDKKAPAIGPTDNVTVDYRGKLLDGTEFDSSYLTGKPATFPVNGVIKGWQEALVLMKPGAKWQLFVPPELAYGPRSQAKIPPNSLLIFEVNLESSEPANAPPKAPPGTPQSPPVKNK